MPDSSHRVRQALGLVGWISLSFCAGAAAALAPAATAQFYGSLNRPAWAPPGWLFGPTWAVLYTMMGTAAWLVWRNDDARAARLALVLFVVQLVANALWTWLFFVWKLGALAVADIAILWLLIVATAVAFARIHRVAAMLLLPYLAWVSFAAALTVWLWRNNPALLG